jgi:dipeptidyl aminopeptidase/acylaminoacyl peptidase
MKMPRLLSRIFLMVVCLFAAQLYGQSFTIEQAMRAPFNSQLTASPVGKRFAWVANQEGKRNLWVAELGADSKSASARVLTHYDTDNGLEIHDLVWTPDGESIAFARGGDFEFEGKAAPNPALIPGGVEQDIWLVGLHGGEARKIAEGHAPAISPSGDMMVYLLKGQIWLVSLRDADAKPEQLFHGRGSFGELGWSPDGKYISFVSERDDHSFVGVYSFGSKSLSYLDPGTELDGEPVWSPDSKQIAFVRVAPDASGIDFKPRRTALPWSIRVVNVATGNGHTVWRAREGMGSVFHAVVADHQLHWSTDGHLVFPWEADGWLHLYSVSLSGGAAVLLTPGAFEVEHVAFSPDTRTMVFSSNQDDIDRRHVWSVGVGGGKVKQITRGNGIEVSPVVAGDSTTVAVLRSDAHVPIRPAVVAGDGELRDLAPELTPADFAGAKFVEPQQVIFGAADGMAIHGQLFLPTTAGDGKRHPAVVFFHGGSRRQMLLGWHYMEYYSNAYAMNQYLASLGYVVLSVNYRSGIGYGLNFREALNYGAAGASEFNDVQGAGLYLRGRADVDAARIGVWGGSYGGYLTALALARASDMFAAGVDFHGVHDWNLEMNIWQAGYDSTVTQEAHRIAWESSPLASVKTWRSPVLLMQGDDDRNVQFSQTVRLALALRQQGVEFEEHVFPDEIHDFLLHRTWVSAYGYGADFFNRHLKAAKN